MKRELWGIVFVVKTDKECLSRTKVIIEMNFLPILGIISGCAKPDLAMRLHKSSQ